MCNPTKWIEIGLKYDKRNKEMCTVCTVEGNTLCHQESIRPPNCESQPCVGAPHAEEHWPLLDLRGISFLSQYLSNENMLWIPKWFNLPVCVTLFFSPPLTSMFFCFPFFCLTARSPLRTVPSPETLTGHSQLMTTSKTLEEMDKTPSTRSARWDTNTCTRLFKKMQIFRLYRSTISV